MLLIKAGHKFSYIKTVAAASGTVGTDYLVKALDENDLCGQYRNRPPYQQNDYIGWITRGKREETRMKRLIQN